MTTFSAPASATSGLQGYDLEGAHGQKTKRQFMRNGGKITLGVDAAKRAPFLGAGIALVTNEGFALFLLRSGEGDHAGEWCFPGGGIEAGETAEQAAIRETFEEAGIVLDPLDERVEVCRIASGDVDFTTFFQRVDVEIEPALNREHDGFRWASLEEPPRPLHPGVRAALPLVISQATELTMKSAGAPLAKGEKRTLYIKRRVRNGEDLVAWAKASGFETTLPPDDLHVTIAFSKEAVDWDAIPRSDLPILRIVAGDRHLERLGKDGEATVLRFESDDLARRHGEIHAAGAVWGWPSFKPHITVSYNGAAVEIEKLTPPNITIELGPEEWAEVNDSWMATVVEKTDAAGDAEMDNLSLFVPVLKVDAKQRIVYGTAVVEEVDRANEIFDYATSKPEFEKWSSDIAKTTDGKSLGNVRAMHGNVAAGKLADIGFDDTRKAIDVAAKIVDDNEWKKCEEGVYTGFSIGGKYLKRWQDGEHKRYTASPSEISLVDLPCGPSATFSMIKADGTEELRKFQQPVAVVTLSNETVAARATELAKAAGDEGKWLSHIEEARKQLEDEIAKAAASATVVPPVSEMTKAADGAITITDKDGNSIKLDPAGAITLAMKVASAEAEAALKKALHEAKSAAAPAPETPEIGKVVETRTTPEGIEQVWVSKRLPGQTFLKKGDLAKALLDLDAREAAAAAAAPVLGVLKAAGTDVDAAIEKRKSAGEVVLVAGDAIASKEALAAVVKAFDAGKNETSERRKLIKAARALGALDLLPEGWVVAKAAADTDELKKAASLYFVSNLLHMLACVEGMEEEAEYTALFGGVAVPKELTDRFGTVLVELGDIVASILDLVLGAMSEEERNEAAKSAQMADLVKRGARHNARDKALIKTTHDTMVSLDKSCCSGAMGKVADDGDDGTAVAKAAEVEAIVAENVLLKAKDAANSEMLKDIKAGVDAMKADMDALKIKNEQLEKASSKIEVDLNAIRYTPVPPPAGTFRVVEKGAPVPDLSAISEDELRRRGDEAQANRIMGPR